MTRLSFPVGRSDPADPPAAYVPLGSRCPHRVDLEYGGDAWLVTGFRDARQVLTEVSFSSDSARDGYPHLPLAPRTRVEGHFLSMDPPEHTRLRRSVAAGFSAQALKPSESAITAHAHAVVDAAVVGGTTMDVVHDFAVPLHSRVIADLFGVPAADQAEFHSWARQMQRHDTSAASRAAATARLRRYLGQLLDHPQAPGWTNLIGRLARSRDAAEITPVEAVAVANLIVVAGLETTVRLLSLAVLTLVRDGTQWDLVCADPQRWGAPAVREALRYWTVVQHGVARVATRDVEVSGRLIRAGEAVVVHLPSANRDPAVFDDPDSFDITRDARGQLAFGYGLHRCLGAALAQLETAVAIGVLARRLPHLALSPGHPEISYLHQELVYGVDHLVVDLDGRRAVAPTAESLPAAQAPTAPTRPTQR